MKIFRLIVAMAFVVIVENHHILGSDFVIIPLKEQKPFSKAEIPRIIGTWKHIKTGLSKSDFRLAISRKESGYYELRSDTGWSRTLVFSEKDESDNFYVAWIVDNGDVYSKIWNKNESRRGSAAGVIVTEDKLSIEPLGNIHTDTIEAFSSVDVAVAWDSQKAAFIVHKSLPSAMPAFQYEYRKELDLRKNSRRTVHAAIYERLGND